MILTFNPAVVTLILTIAGTITGFVVQYNLIKYRLNELENKQKYEKERIDKLIENNNQTKPAIAETEKQMESIITRLERLEEAIKKFEISITRLDERLANLINEDK